MELETLNSKLETNIMNKQNIKLFLFFVIGLLTAFLVMYMIQNYRIEKKENTSSNAVINTEKVENRSNQNAPSVSDGDRKSVV